MATFVEDVIGDLHPLGCLSRLRPAPLRLSDLPPHHELFRRWPTHTERVGTGVWIMPPAAGPNSDTKGALLMAIGPTEVMQFYDVLSGITPNSGVILQGHMYHQMWSSLSVDARNDCSPLMAWHCHRHCVQGHEQLALQLPTKFAELGLTWVNDFVPGAVPAVQEKRRGIDLV
jgi:hypothetical protein